MFWNLCDAKVEKSVILNWLLEQQVVYAILILKNG